MDVRCEKCGTEYEFDENRVGPGGVTVKCTACGFVFRVRRPAPPTQARTPLPRNSTTLGDGPPEDREWLVRKPEGDVIAFRELTTLQKWIVEGRIRREDEISKNGETWKRLGNIGELEPFFSVFEKASALNALIESGDIQADRVELRGSEVLATLSPAGSVPLANEALATARPPALQRAVIQPRTDSEAAFEQGGLSVTEVADYEAGAPLPRAEGPLPSAAFAEEPLVLKEEPRVIVSSPHPHPPARGSNGVARPGTSDAFAPSASGPAPTPASTMARPIQSNGTSDAFREENGLSVPIDSIDTSQHASHASSTHSHLTTHAERLQRLRRFMLVTFAIVVVGSVGGFSMARFGPPGNPVEQLAERYHLLESAKDSEVLNKYLEDAQRAFDLDTLDSLDAAAGLFETAHRIRSDEPAIQADQALALITRAAMLRRLANFREEIAETVEKATEGRAGDQDSAPGEEPVVDPNPYPDPLAAPIADPLTDPVAIRAEVADRRRAASELMQHAFELAALAHNQAPNSLPAARALADYYRVQQDSARSARSLERAKDAMEKLGVTDAATLFIEAARLFDESPTLGPESLTKASALLEQALTTRPSLNRARLLLARIHLAGRLLAAARAQIENVLELAPAHPEAQELLAIVKRAEDRADGEPATTSASDTPTRSPDAGVAFERERDDRRTSRARKMNRQSAEPRAEPSGEQRLEGLLHQADRLRERDQPKQALGLYEKAADMDPTSADPLAGMGWCYLDLSKPSAAIHLFRRALKLNDRYAEAYYGLAEAHRAAGEVDLALEYYERFLAGAPEGGDRKAAERALETLRSSR